MARTDRKPGRRTGVDGRMSTWVPGWPTWGPRCCSPLFAAAALPSVACFSPLGISISLLQQALDLREQERELGPYRVPHDPVVHQVVAVDEHVAEPHDPLVLAH